MKLPPFIRSLAYKALLRIGIGSSLLGQGGRGYRGPTTGKEARFNSIVAACLGWIGRTASEPPLRLMERSDEGTYAPVDKHDALDLLAKPNTVYGWPAMLRSIMAELSLFGNAYLVIKRDERLMVESIYWVSSLKMEPWGLTGGSEIQIYNCGDQYLMRTMGYRILPEDVIHFRTGIDPECPQLGWSPFRALLAEVFTDQAAAIWVTNFLRNGAVPLIVVSKAMMRGVKTGFDQAQADIIAGRFEDQAAGNRIGSTVVLNRGLKIDKIGASADDFDLTNIRLVPEARISGVFGVPPLLAGLVIGHQRATYSNAATARKLGIEQKIIPDLKDVAQTLSDRLLPEVELAVHEDPGSFRFEFDFSQMPGLQEEQRQKSVRLSRMWTQDVITRAEIRGAEGFPIRDEDDDAYYSNVRFGGLGDLGSSASAALRVLRKALERKALTQAQRRYLATRDARYISTSSRFRNELMSMFRDVTDDILPIVTTALEEIEIPKGVPSKTTSPQSKRTQSRG